MAKKTDYTQGSIAATMLKTAVAMLASTLAMSGYNIVDTYFVGHIPGDEGPLAAMGFTFPVVMFIGCIFHGFGTGCMATMAHAVGQKDMKGAAQLVTSGLITLVFMSLFLAILGIFTADFAFGKMGAHGTTLLLVKQYMNVWFLGCVTSAVGMEGNKILIAGGYPRISSAMTILGMLINTILDPFMIFGGETCHRHILLHTWEWTHPLFNLLLKPLYFLTARGIQGAAIATVISQAISAVVIAFFLYKAQLIMSPETTRNYFKKTFNITKYAVPAILGMLLFPISNYIVTWVTAQFGDAVVAGFSAANKLEGVAFVFPMAFGITLMPIIAQNYGAGLYSRVRFCFKFAATVAFCFLTTINALLFFFGHHLAPFISNIPSVQEVICLYFKIIPFGFALLKITRFCGFTMVGCGHPMLDTTFKTIRIACILIPCILITHFTNWQYGIYFSRLATDVLGGILCIFGALYILRKLPKEDKLAIANSQKG